MNEKQATPAMQETSPELSRDLGVAAVFTTATGTMIGAGIFVLPGVAAEGAGPGAVISFLLAGIIAGLAALSVSELATAMPRAGGPYYFVSRAMGPLVGTIVGLGAWLALVFKGSFALVGLGQYLVYFSPVPVIATAVVGGLLLLVVNLMGARATGALQNVVVVVLLLILGVFVVRGLMAVEPANLTPMIPFGWNAVLATTGVVFISYLGIVKAAAVAEEVEDPGRNIPRGILGSVGVVTVLYVGTMLIVTGVLPISEIAGASAPLADAGALFMGVAGGGIMAVAGLLATLSTGNAAILSSSRYPFALARDALMTPWISEIHRRFRTPSRSILVTGGVMIALVLILDVEGLAKLGGVFGMLVFSLVNLSVVLLRWSAPDWYRPSFRVPLFPILPLLGAGLALAPIPQLGLLSQGTALAFVVVGVGWYYRQRSVAHRTGASIQPGYGLRDKLQAVRHTQALAEKRRRLEEEPVGPAVGATVVAELVEGKPTKHLMALAAGLARRYESAVDALVITEVPYQSPLEARVAPPPKEWLAKIRARQEALGIPLRLHPVRARDRAHAILSFAGPETKGILLDWHDEFHPLRLRGSYVDRVLRDSPARVAVLKYRGNREYDRILVATAGSPYAPAEVEMADALAMLTGARLTLLLVLPTGASEVRKEQAERYLQELDGLTRAETALRIEHGDDVVEEILEAGRDHDLIVLGAARELPFWRWFTGHLMGPIADQIAERSQGSVLVAKEPGRIAGRVRGGLDRAWSRLVGRPPRREQVHAPEQVKVEPFPRDQR